MGSAQPTIPGYMHGWYDSGYICLPYTLQLTLNNGRDWVDDAPIGAPTSYLKDMRDMDDVMHAVEEQFRFWIDNFVNTYNKIDEAEMEFKHLPLLSMLYNNCIETGTDIVMGGG